MSEKGIWWIAERCCRARKTILIEAPTKKEAQRKLDAGEGEGVDIHYYDFGPTRVVCRDGKWKD